MTVNLFELDDFLPRERVVRNELTVEGAVIPPGERNNTLHAYGRRLRLQGKTLPEIFRAIETLNGTSCRPPLETSELHKIAISAFSEKDAPGFVPPTPIVIVHDAPPPLPDGEAVMVNLGTVTPEPVTWHWPGRLPAGKGVMIAGDPGIGKSFLLADIVARYTTGAAWPDGSQAPKGKALLLIAEDGLADTLRPRVETHGGDASQVEILTAIQDKQSERPFNLSRDLAALEAALRHIQPVLVGIDPLNSYLGKVDSYRDADVRGVISPLLASVAKYGCVLIWIAHLTKNDDTKALYRPGASIGFVASARIAFVVGEHPEQPEQRVLAQSKNNLAPKAPSLSFRIKDGQVCWGGVVEVTADALLQTPTPEEIEMLGTAAGLIAQLRKETETGSIDVKEANARAALLSIPERTLRGAARRAGLMPYRKGQGRQHRSYWLDPAHPGHQTSTGPTPAGVAGVAEVAGVASAAVTPATPVTPATLADLRVMTGNGQGDRKEEPDSRVHAHPDNHRTEAEQEKDDE